MFIAPSFSLKSVVLDGITLILNSEEAREFKIKYPLAKVKALRKNATRKPKSGECISIPINEYLQS